MSNSTPAGSVDGPRKDYTIQITPIRGTSTDCATSKSPLTSDIGRGYQYRNPTFLHVAGDLPRLRLAGWLVPHVRQVVESHKNAEAYLGTVRVPVRRAPGHDRKGAGCTAVLVQGLLGGLWVDGSGRRPLRTRTLESWPATKQLPWKGSHRSPCGPGRVVIVADLVGVRIGSTTCM